MNQCRRGPIRASESSYEIKTAPAAFTRRPQAFPYSRPASAAVAASTARVKQLSPNPPALAGARAEGQQLAGLAGGQPVSVDQGRQPAKNQQNPISDCKTKTCFVTSLLQSGYNRVTMCYKTLAHS